MWTRFPKLPLATRGNLLGSTPCLISFDEPPQHFFRFSLWNNLVRHQSGEGNLRQPKSRHCGPSGVFRLTEVEFFGHKSNSRVRLANRASHPYSAPPASEANRSKLGVIRSPRRRGRAASLGLRGRAPWRS